MKKIRLSKHYWMPVAPDGWAGTEPLDELRQTAVVMLLRQPWRDVMGKTWEELRRDGWRVIKVRIVPAED